MSETVWILGAGFSKPLGGPLLGDLLRYNSQHNIIAAFPSAEEWLERDVEDVVRLYNDSIEHERLWRDPEEFVDYLDAAAKHRGPAEKRLLRSLNFKGANNPILTYANFARKYIAAECASFLQGANPNTERWAPYIEWFRQVGPDDTIISFNYDLVLELLENTTPGKIAVILPGQSTQQRNRASVYKLHGSLDWKRAVGSTVTFCSGQPSDFFMKAAPHELAIATPGPTKTERTKELEDLWSAAERSIQNAKAIVFVGYRFPPSDTAARLRLLRAMAVNQREYLAVHTVLGPRLSEDDTVRMSQLLRSALQTSRKPAALGVDPHGSREPGRGFTLVQHPLWAQDFLGYVIGGQLTQAWRFWEGLV